MFWGQIHSDLVHLLLPTPLSVDLCFPIDWLQRKTIQNMIKCKFSALPLHYGFSERLYFLISHVANGINGIFFNSLLFRSNTFIRQKGPGKEVVSRKCIFCGKEQL